jgi:hypothetical protein
MPIGAPFARVCLVGGLARERVDHRRFTGHWPPGSGGREARDSTGSSQYLQIIHKAWTIPGRYPRMVKRMLIRRSEPHPRSRKTPSGGRMTAKMILQISLGESVSRLGQRCQEFAISVLETYLAVKGILTVFVGC